MTVSGCCIGSTCPLTRILLGVGSIRTPEGGSPSETRLHRKFVATVVEESSLESGSHRVLLTSLEAIRNRLASGIYFVRVTTEHDGAETETVTILK